MSPLVLVVHILAAMVLVGSSIFAPLLRRAAQAYALTLGRDHVLPDDIKAVAVPVLAHRLVIDSQSYGLLRVNESDALVRDVLGRVPVPM